MTFDLPADVAERVQAQPDPNQVAVEVFRSWTAYQDWRANRIDPEIDGIVDEAFENAKDLEGLSRDELFDRLEDSANRIQHQIKPE